MTLLIAFCDLSKRRLLISVMSSKGQGSMKQVKSDIIPDGNPEWSRCNSFSSSSNDSAIFCDNSKERASRGIKRNRNSSGSSASSGLSYISDKDSKKASVSDAGSSTIQTVVGQSRHNLRRNIIKKTCDCHCTETHTTYKRTSYERIEKTSAKEITIARTNIQFRVENNGNKEVHKVTYKESYSPSKFDGQRSEVEKEFCLQNNGTQEVHKVTYKESFSPKKSEKFCLGDDVGQEFRKVTYEESYSPSKSDGNRKRRSEVQKLYESLHEIEWAKDFSPDNILRQINVRQAASCSMFGRNKPGESPPSSATKRLRDELDAKRDLCSLTPIKLKEDLDEKSDLRSFISVPATKPKEHVDAKNYDLQCSPKRLKKDLRDKIHISSPPKLKEDMVVKSGSQSPLMPVKRLKFNLHDDKGTSSNPSGVTEDVDNKSDTLSSPVPVQRPKEEHDCKSDSSETIKSPPSSRTRSSTLRKRLRKVSTKSVDKYGRRLISRRINKDSNSSVGEQIHDEDSNKINLIQSSVECFELKKNLGNLKIKKHINIKNSSINCKFSSSQGSSSISRNNFELPNSLSTFIPKMYHGLEADNIELTSEFSLPPTFFDIAEEGIRTIDACFREVGAEVVISTCYEANSEIPLLTSVKDSGFSDKSAITDDRPPVLEHCGTCQQFLEKDSKEFLEKPLIKHSGSPCQTEGTKDCQLENETSAGSCKVSYLEEDSKEFHLENETLATSCGSPGQVEDSKEFPFENETLAITCGSPGHMEDSKEFPLENETLATPCESPGQVEEYEYLMLEDGTLVRSCEILGQVEDFEDFQIENETLATSCEYSSQVENSKDFQLENESLAKSCESFDQVEVSKDFKLENGTCEIPGNIEDSKKSQLEIKPLAISCKNLGQVWDYKDFQLENGTLVRCSEISDLKEDTKDFYIANERMARSCESPCHIEDSKDFLLENKSLVKSCEVIEDTKDLKLKDETLIRSCESPCQMEDSNNCSAKSETLVTSSESPGQIEDSKDFLLENKSLVESCVEMEDAKDLHLKDKTFAGFCESSKDCSAESETLVSESPCLMEDSKDCSAESETLRISSDGQIEDSKDFLLENKSLVESCVEMEDTKDLHLKDKTFEKESPCLMEDSKECSAESETLVISSESLCQIEDSIDFQFQNETLIRTCESFYQTENSVDRQVENETQLRTCKNPCKVEDKKCQLQFVCEFPFEANASKDCKIRKENENLVISCEDPYKLEFSEDCRLQSQTLIKAFAKYQDYDFEDHLLQNETPSRSCITYLGESSKDLQFEDRPCHKEDSFQNGSDATGFPGVEINSSVVSETGTSDKESSDYENKSDLDSVCSEESVGASQKSDFSVILERIITNRFKNDSLIKQAGKRILNKYLRILRCEEREEVGQQFYVSTKDISSPVKKNIRSSVTPLEEWKEGHPVVEISKHNVYICKSPEKLTFNHSKSSFRTYSKNKELIHKKNISTKALLVQEKNSNFYRKEPVATTHQPPKKEHLSTLPSVSENKDIKINRSSTLACHYQTLLVHRFNEYTQVILRLSHFTIESLSELHDVLCRTGRDPHCRTLILNGIGESFGLGIDLSPLLGPDRGEAATSIAHAVKDFIEALSAFKKPLVAVVNGAAHGLAMTMLNHADTVIASEKATFCLPQSRLGYFPEGGATFTLPRIVGSTVAMDLILRSRVLTAQEALQINLITEVFDEKSLPLDLVSRVKVFMKNSLASMETTKAMLKMQTQPELLTVLENEVKLLPQMWLSDSCQETMARVLCL